MGHCADVRIVRPD